MFIKTINAWTKYYDDISVAQTYFTATNLRVAVHKSKHISCRTIRLFSHLHNSFYLKPHFPYCMRHNTLNIKSRTTKVYNKGEPILLPLQCFTVYECANLCCDVAATVPLLHSHSWLRHYWNELTSDTGMSSRQRSALLHVSLPTFYKLHTSDALPFPRNLDVDLHFAKIKNEFYFTSYCSESYENICMSGKISRQDLNHNQRKVSNQT